MEDVTESSNPLAGLIVADVAIDRSNTHVHEAESLPAGRDDSNRCSDCKLFHGCLYRAFFSDDDTVGAAIYYPGCFLDEL